MSDDTTSEAYAQRLQQRGGRRWKQLLDVQRPYRWNIRRLDLGRTLDVGCGIGRYLQTLPAGSLGVDHNPNSVAVARSRGLNALSSSEFDDRYPQPSTPPQFDSILLSHVLEHMTRIQGMALLEHYLPFARRSVAAICPQERGYTTDATHVTFLDGSDIVEMLEDVGLRTRSVRSFPLPRFAGRAFTYNETVVLADRP
jgi:SAM-dependent methyltransferase